MMCWHLIASLWGWASRGNCFPTSFVLMLMLFFMPKRDETICQSRFCGLRIKLEKKDVCKTGPLIPPTANLQDIPLPVYDHPCWITFKQGQSEYRKDEVGKWGGRGCHNSRGNWKVVWGWAGDTRKTSKGPWNGPYCWTVPCSDKNQDGTKRIASWNNENKHLKNTCSHLSNNLTTHHYNGFRFVEWDLTGWQIWDGGTFRKATCPY